MDFKTLGENSPIYIVHKKPFLFEMGSLKSKGTKPITQQNIFMPQQMQQTLDVVISVNGSDTVLPATPSNLEVVEYKNVFYSTTPEGAQQAIAGLMQMASNGKAEQSYYDSILKEGELAMEKINPQYAEGKRQARTIEDLQKRQDEQGKMLNDIYALMQKIAPKP
jgi:hypothetical protein